MTANKMVAPNTLSSLNFIPDRGGPYLPPDMTWSPRQGTATTEIHCYDRDALSPQHPHHAAVHHPAIQ